MNAKRAISVVLLMLATAIFSQQASAQLSLSFGDLNLAPNTPGQTIEVFVSGGDQVQAIDVNLLIGDGGAVAGGTNPDFNLITSLDILTGTIFGPNNNGPSGARIAQDGFAFDSTATNAGTVQADGLIATLTLDTTGLSSGSFEITTDSGPGVQGPTVFGNNVPVQAIGTINISAVPEPGSCYLLGLASIGLVVRRRRDVG